MSHQRFLLLTALNPVTQLRCGGFFYWRGVDAGVQFFLIIFLNFFTPVSEWLEGIWGSRIGLCNRPARAAGSQGKMSHGTGEFFFFFSSNRGCCSHAMRHNQRLDGQDFTCP